MKMVFCIHFEVFFPLTDSNPYTYTYVYVSGWYTSAVCIPWTSGILLAAVYTVAACLRRRRVPLHTLFHSTPADLSIHHSLDVCTPMYLRNYDSLYGKALSVHKVSITELNPPFARCISPSDTRA